MTIKGYETYDVLKCACPRPRTCLQNNGPEPPAYGLGNNYEGVGEEEPGRLVHRYISAQASQYLLGEDPDDVSIS